MVNFFPEGFWKTVAMIGMVLFFIFGLDVLLGARLVSFLNKVTGRRFHVDQAMVRALSDIKKTVDREYDVEHSMLRGWGRFVVSGSLFLGAALILLVLMPLLK